MFDVEGARAVLRPHIGRIRDAGDPYDPSGILVDAVDLQGGGMRMELSGAEGCNTPVTGATFSVPLKDVAGRPFGPLQSSVKGAPPLIASFWLRELAQWLNHALPSQAAHWVGIGSAPFQGIATPGDWIFWMVQNHAPGVQRVAQMDREAADAPDLRPSTGAHASIRGVRGGFGSVSGWHDNETYASGVTYPFEHEGPTNLAYRVLNTNALRFPQGSTPHLYFGAGCDGLADVTEFEAGGICISVADPHNLHAR